MRVSNSFSWIIIGLVLILFLLPNIVSRINIYRVESANDEVAEDIKIRGRKIDRSLAKLELEDPLFLSCVDDAISIFRGIHPMNGGIDDVIEIERLNCYRLGINSVVGIEQLTNLQMVDLSNNKLNSIEPLAKLPKLEYLNLSENNISDIGLVLTIPSLTKVMLPENIECRSFEELERVGEFEISNSRTVKKNCH